MRKLGIVMLCAHLGASSQCLQLRKTQLPGVTLAITSTKKSYVVGDGVEVHIDFSNGSTKKYNRVETFYEHEFELAVRDSKGGDVALTEFGTRIRRPPYRDTLANDIEFSPGDKVSLHEDVTKVYRLTEPGVYHISAFTNLQTLKQGVIASIISNELRITLYAPGEITPAR